MKKTLITCAVFLAACLFVSCNNNDPNVEQCFEVTTTINLMGFPMSTTQYVWCTEAQLEAEKQRLKDEQIQSGVSEDFITISSKRSSKSKASCTATIPSVGN